MAEVRLSSNWAGYPPGKIVSVSPVRAEYLVSELKIAKYTNRQLAINKEEQRAKKAQVVASIQDEGVPTVEGEPAAVAGEPVEPAKPASKAKGKGK